MLACSFGRHCSWGCSCCVVDTLMVMVSSGLLLSSSSVAGLVDVDCVFAPVESPDSVSSLLCRRHGCFPFFVLSLVVDWQLDPGDHRFVVAVNVDLSRCFCVFAMFEQNSLHVHAGALLALFC